MTKEQIIRLLECCVHSPLCQGALTLIKELSEKVDDLEMTLEVQRDNLGAAREGWNDAEEKVKELREENERLSLREDFYKEVIEAQFKQFSRLMEISKTAVFRTVHKMQKRFKERIKGIHLDEQEASAIIDQIADEISDYGAPRVETADK